MQTCVRNMRQLYKAAKHVPLSLQFFFHPLFRTFQLQNMRNHSLQVKTPISTQKKLKIITSIHVEVEIFVLVVPDQSAHPRAPAAH